MADLLDGWQPERKAQEAEAVYTFIERYFEIHRKAPTLGQCCDGTMLNAYHVKQAIARLRRQNRLSQSTLRPVHNAVKARLVKKVEGANEAE